MRGTWKNGKVSIMVETQKGPSKDLQGIQPLITHEEESLVVGKLGRRRTPGKKVPEGKWPAKQKTNAKDSQIISSRE